MVSKDIRHIVILDDERKAAEILEVMLREYLGSAVDINIITDPFEAIRNLKEYSCDLVFLDIQMPGLSGFEWLEEMEGHAFGVIFVTAYDQYAIKAIRANALDYLLKPVDEDELRAAVSRFHNSNGKPEPVKMGNALRSLYDHEEPNKSIGIANMDRTLFFPVDEIIRCEAQSNYTWFYFCNGTRILSSKTLKEYDRLLSKRGFLRIHKSHIINPAFILSLKGRSQVTMKDGPELPIARRRRADVIDDILNRGL